MPSCVRLRNGKPVLTLVNWSTRIYYTSPQIGKLRKVLHMYTSVYMCSTFLLKVDVIFLDLRVSHQQFLIFNLLPDNWAVWISSSLLHPMSVVVVVFSHSKVEVLGKCKKNKYLYYLPLFSWGGKVKLLKWI